MTYVRQSQEEYQAQMKEKQIKALRRKARQLGLEVIEKTSVSGATAADTIYEPTACSAWLRIARIFPDASSASSPVTT